MGKANQHYITPGIENRIRDIINKDYIHPQHHACDFTVEVAAGADLKEAIRNLVRRDREGRYDSVYTVDSKVIF